MIRALILVDGEPPSQALAGSLAASHDLILAVDGAARKAAALGISPHLLCGDFDSIDRAAAAALFPAARLVQTHDQNYGDLEKAIRLALDRDAGRITIAGALGGRIDHTLANLLVLIPYAHRAHLQAVGDGYVVEALAARESVPAERTIEAEPGDTLSVLPVGEGTRVTLRGVAWELEGALLEMGTHGLSNVVKSRQIYLCTHRGAVLICRLTAEGDKQES